MNTWDKTRQDYKFKQKLQNVKSTLPKIVHCNSVNGVNNGTSSKIRKNNNNNNNNINIGNNTNNNINSSPKRTQLGCIVKPNYKRQHTLKFMLREFGLSQYLRKLYEMGYDDHNYMKIGMMKQNKFEELIFGLKIFPGHQVKMLKLYEYLKTLHLHSMHHNNTNINKKPNTSYGYSRYPITSVHTPSAQTKPKAVSANTQRHYYPKYNSNSNKIGNAGVNGNANDYFNDDNKYNNNNCFVSNCNEDICNVNDNNNNDNEDIDMMLKCYMKQLNEKLDESYDSVDDSSLSHVNITNDNINNGDKKEVEGVNVGGGKHNVLMPLGNLGSKMKNQSIINNEKNNNNNHITSNKRGPIKLPSLTSKKSNEEEQKANTTHKQPQQEVHQNIKHENNIEHCHIEHNENIPIEIPNNNNIPELLPPQATTTTQKQEQQDVPIEDEGAFKHNNDEHNDNDDDDIYDAFRLNKSADEEYLRQNMEQFDTEYMCRCLGLAVMKHIETAKDKQHITDILTLQTAPSTTTTPSSKETFSFYNSTYNNKIDFIFTFFNNETTQLQTISNLDRLELETDANSTHSKISYINHFKQKKDEDLLKHSAPRIIPRLHSDIGELERDIRFIDEIFGGANMKKKKNYYQFLSDKTKSILNKELSYINEVDSEININNSINNTQRSCEQHTNNNNNNNTNIMVSNSLLKQSNEEQHDNPSNASNNNNNKFTSIGNTVNDPSKEIKEDVNTNLPDIDNNKETFQSGSIESNYVISISSNTKLKSFILKQSEIFDDDYVYSIQRIHSKKYVPIPDPQQIFEFCANIMCLTKMEKEIIIITLIYLERFTFNTGLLLTSRNWRRTIFTAMIIASKLWDDDSFENTHYAQIFTHLSIGEINLLERTFLELIGYKVHIKRSEYFNYFLILKSIALQYNYTGTHIIQTSVKRMMSIQEYAYQMQKKMKRRFILLNNSAEF